MADLYPALAIEPLGQHFVRHIEGLAGITDVRVIAAQLAWRDKQIAAYDKALRDLRKMRCEAYFRRGLSKFWYIDDPSRIVRERFAELMKEPSP